MTWRISRFQDGGSS